MCDHNQAIQVASHLQQDPVLRMAKGNLSVCISLLLYFCDKALTKVNLGEQCLFHLRSSRSQFKLTEIRERL